MKNLIGIQYALGIVSLLKADANTIYPFSYVGAEFACSFANLADRAIIASFQVCL